MNQGLIANITVICILVMIMTGWFQSVLDSIRMKRKYVILLCIGYIVLSNLWYLVPDTNIVLNVGAIMFMSIVALWVYIAILPLSQIGETITSSLLTASLLLLAHEIFPRDPKLFALDHLLVYVSILALATVIMVKKQNATVDYVYPKAITSIVISVLLLDILSVLFIPSEYYGYIGGGYASDLLMLSIPATLIFYKGIEGIFLTVIRRYKIIK